MRFSELPIAVQLAVKDIYKSGDTIGFTAGGDVEDEIGDPVLITPAAGVPLTAAQVVANSDAKWGRRVSVRVSNFNGNQITEQRFAARRRACFAVFFYNTMSECYFLEDGSIYIQPRTTGRLDGPEA